MGMRQRSHFIIIDFSDPLSIYPKIIFHSIHLYPLEFTGYSGGVNWMDYCNSILAALPRSSIDPLQRVQNAAARLITGTGTREHITPALQSLHWLSVKFRITFKLCVLMHLVHIGRAPAYLYDMVTATTDLSSRGRLRSSNTFRYELPLLKRKFGERSFSYARPKVWNDLPFALQELTDTCTFKRQLKTHLFTLAYTNCRT